MGARAIPQWTHPILRAQDIRDPERITRFKGIHYFTNDD